MEYTDTLDDDFMPVFLINGFLEAGKTQFLQFTMQQDYFQTDGKTLLIVCEDGDTEYDTELLKRTKTAGIFIESMAELICNRCDGIEDLSGYRRTLKSMCQRGEIVFEDSEGEINEIADEDLPYDLGADVIEISPEAYGIWYIDCMDRRDRYEGKIVEFTAMVLKSPEFPKNYFVPGRMAMTCCEADMTFLGFVTKAREAKDLQTKQWVKVRAKIAYEFWKDYEGEGPVLYAETVQPAEPIASQLFLSL